MHVAWSHLAENQDHSESPRGSKQPVKCLEEGGKVTTRPGQGGGCRPAGPPSSVCLPPPCQHPQPPHKAPHTCTHCLAPDYVLSLPRVPTQLGFPSSGPG